MIKNSDGSRLADSHSQGLAGSHHEDFKRSRLADSHSHGLASSPYLHA